MQEVSGSESGVDGEDFENCVGLVDLVAMVDLTFRSRVDILMMRRNQGSSMGKR